jgi:hypothetical protein
MSDLEHGFETSLAQLGEIADTADNYWHLGEVMHDTQVRASLRAGLQDIARRLKTLYAATLGENPWTYHPCPHCRLDVKE